MKFIIKNVNVSYEMGGSKESFAHYNIEEKTGNKEVSIDDLKQIAPNKEEYEAMKRDFDKLDNEKQNELTEYLAQVKNGLKTLSSEVLETPIIKEIIAKLKNKLKQLKEDGKDTYETKEGVIAHTQMALLSVMELNKVDRSLDNAGASALGGSSVGGNVSGEPGF